MEKTVYDLLDWAGIEELVYSESANPHGLLGPHVTEEGILIQALIPTAKQVSIKLSNGKHYAMEEADPDGSYGGIRDDNAEKNPAEKRAAPDLVFL